MKDLLVMGIYMHVGFRISYSSSHLIPRIYLETYTRGWLLSRQIGLVSDVYGRTDHAIDQTITFINHISFLNQC